MAFSRKSKNWFIVIVALFASGVVMIKFRTQIVSFLSKYTFLDPITNLLRD